MVKSEHEHFLYNLRTLVLAMFLKLNPHNE